MTYLNNNTKINIKGSHLSEKEMILIEAYKGEGYSNRKIAEKLGRCHQTINNAINKASVIQKKQVFQNSKVYVYEDVKYFADLNHRIYLENRKNKMTLGESIGSRPKEIETREEFGDWEIDTVIGSKKKTDPVLLTLTERKIRYEPIIKIDSKTNKAVEEGLSFLKETNQLKEQVFKTITSDNGLEFSSLTKICEYVKIYYCHPYSSYERATSENQHKLIRRFIKKGEEISNYTDRQIERIMNWMNDYPRKILGYMTAEEAFIKELKLIEKTSLDI